MQTKKVALGAATIALALAFNVPFSILASIYDYPDILRRSPGEALDRFAAGGVALVSTWYGFALAALALAPLAVALSITRERIAARPALAIGAAIAGALAGVMQAVGLLRWIFVVPGLARQHLAGGVGAQAAEQAFDLINAYGGVAIGEHLGQLLTALFVGQLAALQLDEGRRIAGLLGVLTAGAITLGTGEGLAIAVGADGSGFAMVTIAGFVGLTAWLIATGVGLTRKG